MTVPGWMLPDMYPKQNNLPMCSTLPKINMEPKNWLFVDRCFSFLKGVFSGSMFVFGGVHHILSQKSIQRGNKNSIQMYLPILELPFLE